MIENKEVIEELKQIKSVLNRIEIKGEQNANFLLYSCQRCDALIESLSEDDGIQDGIIKVGE